MSHLGIIFVASLLGWLPQAARDRVVPPTPEAVGTAAISGQVTVVVSGANQPIRRARVTLESTALMRPQHTDTNTDGRYRFTALPAGTYRIRVEKAGFVQRPQPVTLTDAQALSLPLVMARGAALEGRILTDTGNPAVNVVVSAVKFAYDARGRQVVPVRQTRTDDRGLYRLHTLPAGEYFLEAAPDPLEAMQRPQVPSRQGTALARSYFPGAPRVEGGETLSLSVGQNRTGLEFALPTIPTAALRGTVVNSTGTPGGVVSVRVQRVGGPVGEVRGSMSPNGNEFMYPSVPSGDYWVMGIARPTPTADLEFGVMRVTVSGQDHSGLTVTTVKGATVNGRVVMEGEAAQLPSNLGVIAHETEYVLPVLIGSTTTGASPVTVAPDGTFTFSSLFSPRVLRVDGLPAGWALRSVTLDGEDVTDTSVDFRSAETARTLRMVVTPRTATISGVVRDDAGRPVAHARVVVFSEDPEQWGWRSRMVRTAESSADGRFNVEGVLDGAYRIVAVPALEDGSWMDPTILRRLEPLASPLPVSGAKPTTMNLVVKPW